LTINIVVAIVLEIDKAFNIVVIIAINLVITWPVTSLWQLKCGSENIGYTLKEKENKRDSAIAEAPTRGHSTTHYVNIKATSCPIQKTQSTI
jgi:hypothetical protein